MNANHSEPGPGFALVIGLDRSDQKVDLCQLGGPHSAPRCSTVSTSPEALLPVISQYDRQIAETFAEHPDAFIFSSLPGAGAVLAPRLLAAFGNQRERYPTAATLQCASAVAPVTRQSGGKRQVHRRHQGA